ncbi:MAG TPA: polya polymerase, partial [Dehalococcoidia bacterium]|nr:polya polymerase [Dehalococcoidia bacterium]
MMQYAENISELVKSQLPEEMQKILSIAGGISGEQQYKLYLVGGMVRDLILGRSSFDLDLVVEGDAVDIARRFADILQGNVSVHTRFRTATVKWEGKRIDFATARSEIYSRPGALPTVKSGNIGDDL